MELVIKEGAGRKFRLAREGDSNCPGGGFESVRPFKILKSRPPPPPYNGLAERAAFSNSCLVSPEFAGRIRSGPRQDFCALSIRGPKSTRMRFRGATYGASTFLS